MIDDQKTTDVLIDEVRQRRREVYAAHGHDLKSLYEAIRRLQAEHPEKLVDRRTAEHRPQRPSR